MPTYPNQVNSKLPKVGTTIFSVMSALANQHDAINLSQGFPNFEVSPDLIKFTENAMKNGMNQYAPMQGAPALREIVCEKVESLYGTSYNPDTEITVTAGATQAIFTAITAVVREGDEVVLFTPAYDCYEPAIDLNGGKTIYVQMKAPTYNIDWDEVKKVVNRRTRMIIINTPHNPTGAVLSAEDLEQLDRLTRNSDILVLSDEVYEHIIFDGQPHQSVARYPELAKRSFIVASFGKTFHATGWKMGYCLAPENLMAEFRKSHQFIVFTCNTPAQYGLAEYLKNEEAYLRLNDFYQQKRDLFVDLIKDSRFDVVPTSGTYFQLLGYKDISDEGDVDYARRLTVDKGIASIPVSVFYHKEVDEKVLRFCFAKDDDTLKRAAEIINKI